MFQVTISGATPAELAANASVLAAALNSTSTVAVAALSPSEQARLRGDATIVPPKGEDKPAATKPPTAAEKKAAEKAAKAAAEAATKAAAEEEETEENEADGSAEDTEEDPLGEAEESSADEDETLTNDDAKKLLLEVRAAYPKDATLVSQIVQEQGKSKKISDVDAKHLPAVVKKCRELLAKAKK